MAEGTTDRVTYGGPDYPALKGQQRRRATKLYGMDGPAGSFPPAVPIPAVSAGFAHAVAEFWQAVATSAVKRAVDGAGDKSFICKSTIAHAFEVMRAGGVPSEDGIRKIQSACQESLTTGLMKSARNMWLAVKVGAHSRRKNAAGLTIMDPVSTRMFWDGVSGVVIGSVGAQASVTTEERWRSFLEGAKEGAENVGDVAGRTAAHVLETAGRAVGAGVGGLADELGIVKVAVGGAVLYGAWRFL